MHAPRLAVRAIDLDHLEILRPQEPRDARAIRAGAFHTDPGQGTEAAQPRVQAAEPGRRRRERLDAQDPAIRIDHSRDMRFQMRVDPARDRARAPYDGHRHPFCLNGFKGWHARPGKETVTSPLRQQRARSPSGTGRAHSPTPRRHAERSDHDHRHRGPGALGTPHPHWAIGAQVQVKGQLQLQSQDCGQAQWPLWTVTWSRSAAQRRWRRSSARPSKRRWWSRGR